MSDAKTRNQGQLFDSEQTAPAEQAAKTTKAKPAKAEPTEKPEKAEKAEKPEKGKGQTAEQMAQRQREISVSEFFTKNRHLLGFDSPRKALLTAVKEAVDNSLDACEEARILPEIKVKISRIGQSEKQFTMTVEDNGPGIPASERELVLQPFYRVLGSNVDGSGLGLSIVSEVAQQYRAKVELTDAHPEQETRRGLKVTVRFPPRQQPA